MDEEEGDEKGGMCYNGGGRDEEREREKGRDEEE